MAKQVCDFCLKESGGLFHRLHKLSDGHYICKDCRTTILNHGLPVIHDLFQQLVTAQKGMRDMIMDAYLQSHNANDALAKYFPLPKLLLHEGETCMNATPATITVASSQIPSTKAKENISDIKKEDIQNIADGTGTQVKGMLYETEVALYFMSEHFINCHRLGHIKRPITNNTIVVDSNKATYTYKIKQGDIFALRERFFTKVMAAINHKQQHLIYIGNDNELTITPGVYEIPRSIKPGIYKVKPIKDEGLHIKDQLGNVKDYFENEEILDLTNSTSIECTGEYELQWVSDGKTKSN